MSKILIVEDDLTFLKILKNFLEKNDFETVGVDTAEKAYRKITAEDFDLVLSDFKLPDESGLDILKWVKNNKPKLRFMIMTRYSDVKTAISSMKLGALDFIIKPINPDLLLVSIKEALKENQTEVREGTKNNHNHVAPSRRPTVIPEGFVKGKSKVATDLYKKVELVAPTNMSVIIEGESGTGKEHVARLIHELSKRNNGPFVAVDCGALSKDIAPSELFGHIKGSFTGAVANKEGQLELADEGTIFLDEIGNLSYEIQVQLLRALQEKVIRRVGDIRDREIDVRIIVATNEDLKASMRNGDFREDLFHRLNEFSIYVPPLRERKKDIDDFTNCFIESSNKQLSKDVEKVSEEVREVLRNYPWPGNIRELKNIVKRSVLMTSSDEITLDCLPDEIVEDSKENLETKSFQYHEEDGSDLKSIISENERDLIMKTLVTYKYNKSKTANALNIDRKTLYKKIRKYNLDT